MKISELIAALQEAQDQLGDLPVYLTNGAYWPKSIDLFPANHSEGREWVESIEVELK